MRWRRQTWQATVPEHHDLLASLPDAIDRATVAKRAACAADGEAEAVQTFVTAMVWGYGPGRVRRLPYRPGADGEPASRADVSRGSAPCTS
ncbi:hypothetical protein [Actinoplanes sp. NPDC049802]|uniref:8-oxoguanine DNA glycosylase OGG fold protein n=1 Tax=Actinoplanes sp. NPDC049802 TaxID=3154742 RepID=UPI0033C08278